MKGQFIKTQDSSCAAELRAAGYQELNKEGSFYVFLNNSTLKYKSNEKGKVVYTDKLCG